MDALQLGLGDPPTRRYLYIGQDEQDSNACWYEFDHESKKKTYLPQRALSGYLSGVRFRTVQTTKGDKRKFELLVDAGDSSFTIRAGANTNFTRGVVLSLVSIANPEDLKRPLAFVVTPSTTNTKIVFGSVFFKDTSQRIKYTWDAEVELAHLVEHLQQIVGDGGAGDEEQHYDSESAEDAPPYATPDRHAAPQQREPPSTTRMISAPQKAEIIRCATLCGLAFEPGTANESRVDLNADCGKRYAKADGSPKTIEDLTFDEALEYRKLLLAM